MKAAIHRPGDISRAGPDTTSSPVFRRRGTRFWTIVALASFAAFVAVAALGEAYLRRWPPRDLWPWLGDATPLSGPFQDDPELAVAYRSYAALRADNSPQIAAFENAAQDPRPTWAMFGNSFVHAPGMLADTARTFVPDRNIVNLGRSEHLPVRAAQIRMLLDNGFAPRCVFFVMLSIDVLSIGPQPLASWRASPSGAIVWRPRSPPPPFDVLLHSRLGLNAWIRMGRHAANPEFRAAAIDTRLYDLVLADLDRIWAALRRVSRRRQTPIILVLLPNRGQLARGVPFTMHDEIRPRAERSGLTVFDLRARFLAETDRTGLFLRDGHFNERGNRILLEALRSELAHAQLC